ncbi:hypothetical protein LguiA_029802 [Lonicera macranthoides]
MIHSLSKMFDLVSDGHRSPLLRFIYVIQKSTISDLIFVYCNLLSLCLSHKRSPNTTKLIPNNSSLRDDQSNV